jgi:hypothetical protein
MSKVPRPTGPSRNQPPMACAGCGDTYECTCLDSWPLLRKVLPLVERLVTRGATPALRVAFATWLVEAKQEEMEQAAAERAPRALRPVVADMIGQHGPHGLLWRGDLAESARIAGVSLRTAVRAKRWIADGGLAQEVTRGS